MADSIHRRRHAHITALPLILVLARFGVAFCAEKAPSSERAAGAPLPKQEVTDDEYREFAITLERAARSGNLEAFNKAVDWDGLVARATTPREGTKEFNDLFTLATLRDHWKYGIGTRIIALAKDGGEFRCLRIHTIDETKRVLFRLLVPMKPSLDYFEFELARGRDGAVLASDYYSFCTGELASQAIRRRYRSIAAAASKALAGAKVNQQEMELAKADGAITEMQACSRAGNGRRALEIYARLPAALQNEKTVLLTRIEAANLVGGKEYDEALRAIRSALPDDPCLDFVLVDYYFLHRQYDQLRAAIDRVDKRLGGDPCQDARRAMTYLQEKNYKLAREYARKALAAEDRLVLAHSVLLQAALDEKDFDEVSRLLTVMEEKSLATPADLTTIPAFAEFVKSAQYQAWATKRKTK